MNKHISFFRILSFFLVFLGTLNTGVYAQAFPVTAVVQTLPPFSGSLQNWVDPLNQNIGLTLLLNDSQEPGYQVRLEVTIEGNGIVLRTRQNIMANPISLNFGSPVQLGAAELRPYFLPDNLDFTGISRSAYRDLGGLPEGVYSICVRAIDFARTDEEAASAPTCGFANLQLLDPPVVLNPIGTQTSTSPQFINVQWTPRHIGMFNTNYRVEVYQVPQGGAIQTAEQIYTTQPRFVTLELGNIFLTQIGPDQQLLDPGFSYLLRVQARDPDGRFRFKNDGYSEPVFFNFETGCSPPLNLNASVNSFDAAAFEWSAAGSADSYLLSLQADAPGANTYPYAATGTQLEISDLTANTTYKVRIQSVCDNGESGPFSPEYSFTTGGALEPELADCGTPIDDILPPSNVQPIVNLQRGDTVYVSGGFSMVLRKIGKKPDSTNWEGFGQVYVPWLGKRINARFTELGVNTERVVFAGDVIAVDKGLESLNGFMTVNEIMEALDTASVDFCGTSVPAPLIDTTGIGDLSGPDVFSFLNDPVTDLPLSAGGFDLPLTLGTSPSTIALFGMRFSPTGAYLNAYFSAEVPIANQTAAFQARQVEFGPGGLQATTDLELLSPISFSYGGKLQMTIEPGDETFVSFNCEGLEEVGLAMEVQLCPDVARAVDPYTYEPLLDSYVTGNFNVRASTWGEFSGKMQLSAFELTQLPGWAFSVDTAVLDLSASFTDATVVFPTNYEHPDVLAGSAGEANPAWQGLYLRAARIRIPDRFTGRTEGNSATVGIENMIVDRTGFTGELFATNIITLEQGSMANWGASLDSVALAIQSNQFRKVFFKGNIQVPALRDPLAYACRFEPTSEYSFEISTTGDVIIDAMAAQVTLAENSTVKITYFVETDEVVAEAILHGRATFGPSLGGGEGSDPMADTDNGRLALPSINFDDFHLISKAPYIKEIGSWSLESDEALTAGFPLTLNEIGMFQSTDKSQVAFGLDLTLNLVKGSDQGFGAEGRAFIICDVGINEQTQRQEWTFNSVRLDKLTVEYTGGAFEMRGYIQNFAGNPEYGTGFQGGIQVSVQPGFSVALAAMFGKVDGYRYFFVDAKLGINPGIPLGPSGLAIYGFGGGVSYHMKRRPREPLLLPISEGEKVGAAPEKLQLITYMSGLEQAYQTGIDPADAADEISPLPDRIGQSLSGVEYVPDSLVGFGIKAMIAFGSINRQVFNGDITFEIIFNTNGSLNYIGLQGNANIMTPPATGGSVPESVMSFYAEIGYSTTTKSLDAYLRFQLQYPPGQPILRGAHPQNVVGEGQIHFGPEDWFFYIGTPDKRLAIALDLSSMVNIARDENAGDGNVSDNGNAPPLTAANNDSTTVLGEPEIIGLMLTAYLDAGTILPAFPPPPEEVLSILDDPKWRTIGRDDPRYANAGGLMFGASLKINMPSLRFLMFYGHIKAGIGFDLMLRDYGIGARCAQNINAEQPIGINGWYATGQLYGYLDARFGIDISMGLLGLEIEIMQIKVAAILQARLPNPFFMRGAVKGDFAILNGLIRGRMDFEFSAGEPCDIVDARSQDVSVIQSITPREEEEDVSVFAKPQVIFNLPVGVPVPILDRSDANQYVQIKIQQQYVRVVDVETNNSVRGTITWDDSKTVAAFRPDDILPPNRTYRVEVKVQVLQKRPEESTFTLANLGGSIPVEQELTSEFTTGEAPDYIPEENVIYAYPINLQTAFLKEESPTGYVQLDQGQDYLFGGDAGAELVDKLRFTRNKVAVAITDFTYDNEANRIDFNLPAGQLALGTIYGMDVVRLPVNPPSGVADNVTAIEEDLAAGQFPDSSEARVLLNTQQTAGTLEEIREQLVYHLDFRTSQYPSFSAKVAALSQATPYLRVQALIDPGGSDTDGSTPFLSIFDFGNMTQAAEAFDRYDLEGFHQAEKDIDPLIRAEADLTVTGSDWYTTYPKPAVYDNFPRTEAPYYFDLEWRSEDPFALPPTRAITLRQPGVNTLAYLSEYAIRSGNFPALPAELEVNYHLPYVMYRDYADYWNQVLIFADRTPELMTPEMETFVDWDWRNPQSGVYNVTLRYFLPGNTEPNSTATYALPYTDDASKK